MTGTAHPSHWRRWLAIATTVLLIALLSGCRGQTFTLSTGEDLAWSSLRGDWVFINYWAIWCKPCIEEMPELNRVHQHAGVTVLGVNFDRPPTEQLREQARRLGVGFPVLQQDPAGALGFERPQVLPSTFVFDSEGRYRGTLVGPQTLASLNAAKTAAQE